jgi:hypothetical protein
MTCNHWVELRAVQDDGDYVLEESADARAREAAAVAARLGVPASLSVGPLVAGDLDRHTSNGSHASHGSGSGSGAGAAGSHSPQRNWAAMEAALPASSSSTGRMTLPEYKSKIASILAEFLLEEDYDECRRCVRA